MSIDTAVLLGFFALVGVGCVCAAWVITSIINARLRIEQERTERAYHLKEAERARIEAARYAVGLAKEQRVLAQWHVQDEQR